MEELIPNYTKEDFLESTAPYEWLANFKDDRLKLKQMTTIMSAKASAVKVRNFVAMFKAYMDKEDKTMYRDGMDRYEEHNIVLENKILIPDSIYTELNWIFGVDVNAFDATVRDYIIKKITINDEQDGITLYLMHPTGGLMIVDIIAFKTDEGGVIIRVNKAEPTCVIHL